jgi:hypothetical protein
MSPPPTAAMPKSVISPEPGMSPPPTATTDGVLGHDHCLELAEEEKAGQRVLVGGATGRRRGPTAWSSLLARTEASRRTARGQHRCHSGRAHDWISPGL